MDLSANSALRKALPMGKTVDACTRCPTKDSSLCLSLTTLAPARSFTMACSLISLSAGNDADITAAFS